MSPQVSNILLTTLPYAAIVIGFIVGVLYLSISEEGDPTPFMPVLIGSCLAFVFGFVAQPLYRPTSTYHATIKHVASVENRGEPLSTVRMGETTFSVIAGPDHIKVGEQGLLKRYGGVKPSEACFQGHCYLLFDDPHRRNKSQERQSDPAASN